MFIEVLDASFACPLLYSLFCKFFADELDLTVLLLAMAARARSLVVQVRVYFPKRLSQQLEAAREEYIRATVGVWKEHRVLLPKLVGAYARDAKLSPERLVDAVQRSLPEALRTAVQRCRRGGGGRSAGKVVEWVPHRQSFRYLLARDLAFPHLS